MLFDTHIVSLVVPCVFICSLDAFSQILQCHLSREWNKKDIKCTGCVHTFGLHCKYKCYLNNKHCVAYFEYIFLNILFLTPLHTPLSRSPQRIVSLPMFCSFQTAQVHLEVLEENLPSSSSKARPVSPGDKGGFVTQLTSVAKNVLGPIKGASQDESSKARDSSRSAEDRRGNAGGRGEASSGGTSGGGRRGAQMATSSAGVGSAHLDSRGSSRSSKHHSW